MSSTALFILLGFGVVICAWVVYDYRLWKSLGKGGVPYNLWGWLIVQRIGFHARETRGTDVYQGSIGMTGDVRRLPPLPMRWGARPRMGKHVVPHRQLDQPSTPEARQHLGQVFDNFVHHNEAYVRYESSFYEKRNQAVTLRDEQSTHPIAKISHGEVAHIHPGDGSMHMIFSASDAKEVIEKGWGERHPLSGSPHHSIPSTYLMIYAPRSADEVLIVAQLLRAAVEGIGLCECRLVHGARVGEEQS